MFLVYSVTHKKETVKQLKDKTITFIQNNEELKEILKQSTDKRFSFIKIRQNYLYCIPRTFVLNYFEKQSYLNN